MAVVVVGGSGRGVGKTALVCGVIAALKEFAWIAVKVTTHAHANLASIYEESAPGQGSDTARYLAAGARRAFLLSAEENELERRLQELEAKLEVGAHIVYESNRVLLCVNADAVIGIGDDRGAAGKASFPLLLRRADALAVLAEQDRTTAGERPVFELAAFEHIPAEMGAWLRGRLRER